MNRRDFLHNAALCVLLERPGQGAQAADSGDRFTIAASKGRQFLVSLFDPAIGLLPEYRDARVFWLFHDNYLAAKVLEKGRSDLSLRLQKAIRNFGVTESGKIEIIFDEAKRPLPFRQPELIQVKQLGQKTIKTEVLTDRESKGWEDYADLLLLASISLSKTDAGAAKQRFNQALVMWDGMGLRDRATTKIGMYAVYKLALVVIAAQRLNEHPAMMNGVVERLLKQQAECGGWITDYTADGKPVGLANVETTSLAVLALDTLAR